jgi:Holliday junction resolvasome RuvABC endonuclease subunit
VIAVGIDPSLTCTGVAAVDPDISASGGVGWFTNRARTEPCAETVAMTRRRLRLAAARTLALVPERFDVCVIEKPSERSQHGKHNERVGLYWFLVDQLLPRGLVVAVGPKTRAKYATGNGNADKAEVLAAMRRLLPVSVVPDHNVADAVALALMGARYLRRPLDVVGVKQEQAYAAVAWPGKG